jgi:lipooligosaccharide transport system permease protein
MAITSYMSTFQQMDWINIVMLPMFLFSATFFPLTIYPLPVQWVVQAMPLWHAVELIRGLTLGELGPGTAVHIAYFTAMVAIGVVFTTRRLRALFLD